MPPWDAHFIAPNQALNSDPYIVLGHSLWKRLFGSDPKVVGRTVHLNGHPFTVIGVAPPNFTEPSWASTRSISSP